MDEHMDDLDHALMALPLAEPPRDLRAKILARTIARPVPVFSAVEIWLIVTIGAIVLWLGGLVALDANALAPRIAALWNVVDARLESFLTPSVFTWVAVGGAIALWIVFFQAGVLRRINRA
jgi:hypothetical protein